MTVARSLRPKEHACDNSLSVPKPVLPRSRVKEACDICRVKRLKCDGTRPSCLTCSNLQRPCTYLGMYKPRRNTDKYLKARVQQYEAILDKLQYGTGPEVSSVLANLQSMREDAMSQDGGCATPPASSTKSLQTQLAGLHIPPTTPEYQTETADSQEEEKSPTKLPQSCDSSLMVNDQTWSNEISRLLMGDTLPPKELLERGISSFFEGSAIMFDFFAEGELAGVLQAAYDQTLGSTSRSALCQACVMAAIGCQYQPEQYDELVTKSLLAVVKLNIGHCNDSDALSQLRLMALLSIYFTCEKKIDALMYAELGLRFARMNERKVSEESPSWKRTVRSLLFLSDWLSATTGFLPDSKVDLADDDGEEDLISPQTPACIDEEVRIQIHRVSQLTMRVVKDVFWASTVSNSTITQYTNLLERWLLDLPGYMRFDSVLGLDHRASNLKPIMLVHLQYMGALIFIYRRSLIEHVSVSASDSSRTHQPSLADSDQYFWSCRQTVNLLEAAFAEKIILRRCWLYINTIYSTSTLLLYLICRQLMLEGNGSQIASDLQAIEKCAGILRYCGEYDQVARTYFLRIISIYRGLQGIFDLQRSSEWSETTSDNEKIALGFRSMLGAATQLLLSPFDGGSKSDCASSGDSVSPSSGSHYDSRASSASPLPSVTSAQLSSTGQYLQYCLMSDSAGIHGFLGDPNRPQVVTC